MTMNEFVTIKLDGQMPLLAAAIHSGHALSGEVAGYFALSESDQLREEDPFTWIWTGISENRIIAHLSRFEFDLNRPPEKAVYLEPSDSWGLKVWRGRLPDGVISRSLERYKEIYLNFRVAVTELINTFGKIVVFDLHSYNHRRGGPEAPPEESAMNPEINLGTGTLDRGYWAPIVDRFISDLRGFDFSGRHLDVRENIKFKGGHFPRWIHETFDKSVCCLSIEVKKFFMDEWTGEPDHTVINTISNALKSTLPGVLGELSNIMCKT
jgi:N-formylglutamate deformylase